jgi:hypothetical protein
MPDAFVAAKCPGKPFAFGFGSIFFSVMGGGSAGPSIYAAPVPDPGTYDEWDQVTPGNYKLPKITMIEHGCENAEYSDPQRALRAGDYQTDFNWGFITPVSSSRVDLGSQAWDAGQYNTKVMNIYAGTGAPSNGHTLTWVSGTVYDVSPNVPALDGTSRWEVNMGDALDWHVNGGQGYWMGGDMSRQATVWIEGTKHGVLVLGTFMTGRRHYALNIFNEGARHEMLVYNPDNFVMGGPNADKIQPARRWNFEHPMLTYPLPGNGLQHNIDAKWMSMAYNKSTRKIAVIWTGGWTDGSDNYPIVSIYQVAGSN